MMSQGSTTTMSTTSEHRDATLQSPSSANDDVGALSQQHSQQLNDDNIDNSEEKEQDENDSRNEKEISSNSPLGNGNTFNTTTMICKPQQNQFVNEMQFNFTSIKSLLLTGRVDIGNNSEDNNGQAMLCTPGRSAVLTTNDDDTKDEVANDALVEEEKSNIEDDSSVSKATNLIEEGKEEEKEDEGSGNDDTQSITSRRGPISLLFMLYNYIRVHLLDLFGNTKSSKKKNKSSNQLRMEERIRRELALEKKKINDEPTSINVLTEVAAATAVPKDTTNTITAAKVDESFLPSSSLIGPTEMISGKVHQEIQLIIHVDDIKFTHHPELSSSSTSKEDTYTNNIASQRYNDDEEYQTTHVESKEEDGDDIETPDNNAKDDKLRQQRRITSERYFVRLIIDSKVVGDTNAKQLEKSTFVVKLSHKFNCKLTSHKPTSVCLQIWKKSSIGFFFLPDSLISTCFVPVEEEDEEDEDGLSLSGQFSSSTGNGGNELQHGLKGALSVTSSCRVRSVQSGPATCKAPPQQLPSASMFRQSLIRPPVVTNDDNNDNNTKNNNEKTTNNNLYHNHHQSTTMEFKDQNSGISFSNTSLIEEPLRHVLIKQRQRNPSSVSLPIPLAEREIQNNDVYHDLIRNEQEFLDDITTNSIVQYDRISSRVKQQHLLEVYNGIKEYTQQTRRKKHHQSDIIHDVGLFRFFVNDNSQPSSRSLTANNNGNCSLLLTIVCGKNVPIQLDAGKRMSQHQLPSNNHDSSEPQLNYESANDKDDDEEEERYLGVLVKIKFRGKTYQTKAVVTNHSGSMSPQWKETICLPLNNVIEEGGNSSSTHVEDEFIDLSLFDCTAIDLRRMGGFYEDENTRSTELRYLSHASLSLSIILRQGTMNGLIPCHSPDVIVGYDDSKSPSSDQETSNTTTMLRIHVITQPFTIVPPRACLDFPSVESEKLLARVEQWSLLKNGYDNTVDHCRVLWPDSRGNTHLVSRFLTEHHSPPHGFDSVASCAHYVSLLPLFRRSDWKALEERDERTVLTTQQCLNILAGTPQEHAILLANFFSYLNKKRPVDFAADVYLVVGFSIPEGKTAWVMRQSKSSNEVVLWNALTGTSYLQTDDTCPLQKIYYLASIDNIYSNVEPGKKPFQLNFDLSNRRKWTPLHKSKLLDTATRMTIQDESLQFSLPDHQYARELESEISESLQNAIRSARRVATNFRSDVGTMIGHTIEKLEDMKMSGQQISSSMTTDIELPESITNTRTVFGFSLHAPFTSIQDVLDRVEATEIHCNMNPRIEFGIAVRCFAYPGGVISLWVFVCSLTPKG